MQLPEGVDVDRRKNDPWRDQMANRMSNVEESLKTNTELTQSLKQDTSDIVDFFKAAKGGLKVLGWFGHVAKWLGIIAGAGSAIAALYYQIKSGGPPK